MFKWLFFISTALIFTACADLNKSEQLERIDTMEDEVSEWSDAMNNFDSEAWILSVSDVEATVEAIKQIESDTISVQEALAMETFTNLQLEMLSLHPLLTRCGEGAKEVMKRLKKLKIDIDLGNGQRHKYDTYLTEEEAQVAILREDFKRYMQIKEKVENALPEAQKDVNAILNEHLPQ